MIGDLNRSAGDVSAIGEDRVRESEHRFIPSQLLSHHVGDDRLAQHLHSRPASLNDLKEVDLIGGNVFEDCAERELLIGDALAVNEDVARRRCIATDGSVSGGEGETGQEIHHVIRCLRILTRKELCAVTAFIGHGRLACAGKRLQIHHAE